MKLLLRKNVDSLGIVGDVVDVASGYARNYLLPHGLATEPTAGNVRQLAEARRIAERERAEERARLELLAERLQDVEVTIRAAANEDGVLYGSVSKKDIAVALEEEGYIVTTDRIQLHTPIRHLDNVKVDVRLADDLFGSVKVWVVRDKPLTDDEESEVEEAAAAKSAADETTRAADHEPSSMEAGFDDNRTGG